MANVWLHNGFVQVEGRKMAKSEGNFVTIHDVLHTEKVGGRKWPGEVVRLALLMTHYREPLDFSVKRLEEAEHLMARWPNPETSDAPCPPDVLEALLDDLNTPAALQGMQRLCTRDTAGFAAAAAVLGVAKAPTPIIALSSAEAEAVDRDIATRLGFIANKDWAEADRIRDELAEQGIQLKDGKDPETGERVTTWEVKR
jgi:cysteinyl-tRNA synthetase